jgi:hypothetical protein
MRLCRALLPLHLYGILLVGLPFSLLCRRNSDEREEGCGISEKMVLAKSERRRICVGEEADVSG